LKQPIPILKIMATVAAYYNVTINDIGITKKGKGRRDVPRWVAMKLCQELGGCKIDGNSGSFQILFSIPSTACLELRAKRKSSRTAAESLSCHVWTA